MSPEYAKLLRLNQFQDAMESNLGKVFPTSVEQPHTMVGQKGSPRATDTRKSEEEWQGSYGSTKSAWTMGRNPLPCIAAPFLGSLKIFLTEVFHGHFRFFFGWWSRSRVSRPTLSQPQPLENSEGQEFPVSRATP